jgi:ADP-heptose:LPS heptosyltransferase
MGAPPRAGDQAASLTRYGATLFGHQLAEAQGDMISFFTSLKPFRGTTAIQQRNALRSWHHAVPGSEVIVFDAVAGAEDLITEIDATYRPNVACNEYGTPLISAMFAEAQQIARHVVLCYINGDIILLPDFGAAIARLSRWKTFAAVGRRSDLDWAEPVDFARAGWDEMMRARVRAQGRRHDAVAMDFFAFRRGAVGALPEFAIGRPAWDNYLIKHLLSLHIPIVDLSPVVVPIHQNHNYAHVRGGGGAGWEGPEADRNRRLAARDFWKFNPRYYTIQNAQWVMLERATVPAISPQRAWWRLLATIPDPIRNVTTAVRNVMIAGLYRLRRLSRIRRFIDLYISTFAFRRLPRRQGQIAVTRVDNIGDFILWLDGARAIRNRYPRTDYHVTLIASTKWSRFAESSALFDEVIAVDMDRFFSDPRYRRATCREVARRRFETTINPTYSRSMWGDDFLVKATGASMSIGHAGDRSNASDYGQWITNRWYGELVSGAGGATHELEKNWLFAKRFDPRAVLRYPKLEPGMIRRPRWLPDDNRYFVLFPGAAWPIKLWPVERFGEIAARVHAKTGWAGIVCGGASDSSTAQQLIACAKDIPIKDACAQTTLPELAGVIADAKLMVTNDTSAAHLAAALCTPAVAILGGGHFGRFLPYPTECEPANGTLRVAYHAMPCYQCNWRCVHARRPNDPGPCIAWVTVDDVWAIVEGMLERSALVCASTGGNRGENLKTFGGTVSRPK